MSTFTPFLCPVTPYGTPHFVSLSSNSSSSILSNMTAEELCRNYWLLESVTIHYAMLLSGTLEIVGDLLLGGMYGVRPVARLLSPTHFTSSFYHSSCGVQSEAEIDFSTVYDQGNQRYAAAFDFVSYNLNEGVGGSNLLLAFYRSTGTSGQRNQCKTRSFTFLGSTHTVYLNYNSQIWSSSDIELNAFSITTTFFANP